VSGSYLSVNTGIGRVVVGGDSGNAGMVLYNSWALHNFVSFPEDTSHESISSFLFSKEGKKDYTWKNINGGNMDT